jgi:hypothetical protein
LFQNVSVTFSADAEEAGAGAAAATADDAGTVGAGAWDAGAGEPHAVKLAVITPASITVLTLEIKCFK